MEQVKSEGLTLSFESPYIAAPGIQQQLQQLIQQRGALRHITEVSLQAEIDRRQTADGLNEDGEGKLDTESDDDTPQARQERLWKARDEMMQKLAYAQNEILSALDFVSLLLSGNSTAAQASMSPALKERVPTGSLEAHAVVKQQVSTTSKQSLVQASEGWKAEGFKSASTKLDQAATRLEREAERQNRYWDQVASLKTQKWSVSRLPTDSRAVGVHYGFPEAAVQFRSKSFALLQQDESGDLQLDARSIPEVYTKIKVSLVRDSVETGSSWLESNSTQQEKHILSQMREVRDAVYEEELFYEISREARLIANQGVRTLPGAVEFDVDTHTQIRIAQASAYEVQTEHSNGLDDELAALIATSLRLLLSFEHNKSKEQRCRPPSAISLAPKFVREYALLRPVLAHLRHEAALSALHTTCTSFLTIFEKAGIKLRFTIARKALPEQLTNMQLLRQPTRSTLSIDLESSRKIELDVETYLGSPIYGTVFHNPALDFGFVHFPGTSLNTVEEAAEYLTHTLTSEVIAQTEEFEVLRPHSGEVLLRNSENIVATVTVRPQRISISTSNPTKTVYSWRPSGFQRIPNGNSTDSKTFREVVSMLGKTNQSVRKTKT